VASENLPSVLKIVAKDRQGQIMALRHSTKDVFGVQFHPESIMTPHGTKIISDWLTL
jgi:anthranilate synthase component 2